MPTPTRGPRPAAPAAVASAETAASQDSALAELAACFPSDFVWGVATSAFQIEGATREGGRGESIWDRFCRQPGAIADGSDGDVACDHYHRLEQDLDLIASLGVGAYRFSISWPRVQPDGSGAWNETGLDFYERLVDGLLARGIAPWPTLNHWDLPQALQDDGGWGALETVNRFVSYARQINRRIGDRCAAIATHNEPWVIAVLGHQQGIFAPGLRRRAMAMQVAHHLLLSHGQALQALRADGCRAALGIVLNLSAVQAASDDAADLAAARLEDARSLRWYCDPLFHGRYPAEVLDELGSDAPWVGPGDMAAIATPMDFLGVNNYSRTVVSAGTPWDPRAQGMPVTDMGWEICPQALTELLLRLRRDYAPQRLLITENGAAFADPLHDGQVHDDDRVRYLHGHIRAVAEANRQGAEVGGYMAWSLMDNFEWASGYAKRFGLVHVDYATQRRTPKRSALWYRSLLQAWRAAPRQGRG
ncbi:MAG TPA: GH1 family beta-glucosidase [Rubrivivax sp.]|jgi:beta-glucosidase|nr:GH1 family beta-glucosidase [Rubrivivax sp.]